MTVRAADLIAERRCHPICLLAQEPDGKCTCVCQGEFHGMLADAPVAARSQPWYEACHRGGWSELLLEGTVPVVRTMAQENAAYQRAKKRGDPHLIVRQTTATKFTVDFDLWPARITDYRFAGSPDQKRPEDTWLLGAIELINRMSMGLLRGRRCDGATGMSANGVTWSAWPFRVRLEAMVVAALIGECYMHNLEGIARAVSVLEGGADPVDLGVIPSTYVLTSG